MDDLRMVIVASLPQAIEEVKWRKPSNPDGVPVWSLDGMICVGNILKSAVRLTFPKGARLRDPRKLFNTRLDSKTVRAVDFRQGLPIDRSALGGLLRAAATLNASDAERR